MRILITTFIFSVFITQAYGGFFLTNSKGKVLYFEYDHRLFIHIKRCDDFNQSSNYCVPFSNGYQNSFIINKNILLSHLSNPTAWRNKDLTNLKKQMDFNKNKLSIEQKKLNWLLSNGSQTEIAKQEKIVTDINQNVRNRYDKLNSELNSEIDNLPLFNNQLSKMLISVEIETLNRQNHGKLASFLNYKFWELLNDYQFIVSSESYKVFTQLDLKKGLIYDCKAGEYDLPTQLFKKNDHKYKVIINDRALYFGEYSKKKTFDNIHQALNFYHRRCHKGHGIRLILKEYLKIMF